MYDLIRPLLFALDAETAHDLTLYACDVAQRSGLSRWIATPPAEIDVLIEGKLAKGWTLARLDKPMKAIIRVGTYELLARKDVPVAAVISEYVDVAHAFYDKRESGFVNGLLDGIAKEVRA